MMTFMRVPCLRGVVGRINPPSKCAHKRPLHVLTQPCGQTRTDWSTNAEASAMVAGKDRRGEKQAGKSRATQPSPPSCTPARQVPGSVTPPCAHIREQLTEPMP